MLNVFWNLKFLDYVFTFFEVAFQKRKKSRFFDFQKNVKRYSRTMVCASCCQAIFTESPWVAVLVFGVPTFVISLVCYAICCLAPADDDDTRQSSDDEAEYSELAERKLYTSVFLVSCFDFSFSFSRWKDTAIYVVWLFMLVLSFLFCRSNTLPYDSSVCEQWRIQVWADRQPPPPSPLTKTRDWSWLLRVPWGQAII